MEHTPLNQQIEQLSKLIGQALAKRWMAVLSELRRDPLRRKQDVSGEPVPAKETSDRDPLAQSNVCK